LYKQPHLQEDGQEHDEDCDKDAEGQGIEGLQQGEGKCVWEGGTGETANAGASILKHIWTAL